MKSLVDWAIKNSGDEKRYRRRLTHYPILARLGGLSEQLSDISNDQSPWFCHGLALRMATFSEESESSLALWEQLLILAQQAEGWKEEFKKGWEGSWAQDWDRFHQFLWQLQCYQYFHQQGHTVSFANAGGSASPDLRVKRSGKKDVFVECYFYSKWWPREEFLELVLRKIDPNLKIKRTYNIASGANSNPFAHESFVNTLQQLGKSLTPDKLAELRELADKTSPQTVCELGDIKIVLEGVGEYQPSQNAHGDPEFSWPIFSKEIIHNKKGSNNLNDFRPNLLLVNGLGLDFQFCKPTGDTVFETQRSIDEVWITNCGVDEKLAAALAKYHASKQVRQDYSGSGL